MVGGAGLIRLHEAIVFVSRMVSSQDVHLIPALRLPKVREGHSKGGSSSDDPLLTQGSLSFFQAFKTTLLIFPCSGWDRSQMPITVWCGLAFCDTCRPPQVLKTSDLPSNCSHLLYPTTVSGLRPSFLGSAQGVLNSSLLSQVCWLPVNS